MTEIHLAKAREVGGIRGDAVRGGRVGQDPRVGAPRHRDALEGVRDGEDLFERKRHRARTGAAGEYKRTVDVEQDECGGSRPNFRRERCRRAGLWPTVLRRS